MEKLLCFVQITALVLLIFMMRVQGNIGKTGQSDESQCLYLKRKRTAVLYTVKSTIVQEEERIELTIIVIVINIIIIIIIIVIIIIIIIIIIVVVVIIIAVVIKKCLSWKRGTLFVSDNRLKEY